MSGADACASLVTFDKARIEHIEPCGRTSLESMFRPYARQGMPQSAWRVKSNAGFSCIAIDHKGYAFAGSNAFPFASTPHFCIYTRSLCAKGNVQSQEETKRFVIEDFSKNGTYLNGLRMHEPCALRDGDWIFAAGALFVFFEDALFGPSSAFENEKKIPMFDVQSCEMKGGVESGDDAKCKAVFDDEPEREMSAIEAYMAEESLSNESLSSPAGMMIISSLASVVSGILLNPKDLSAVWASLAGSSITALAFAGWYRAQARKRKNQVQAQSEQTLQAYLDYLDGQAMRIDELRRRKNQCFGDQAKLVEALDVSLKGMQRTGAWKLPAGICLAPVCRIEMPQIVWHTKNERGKRALEALEKLVVDAAMWITLEPGKHLRFGHCTMAVLRDVFALWVWMIYADRRRFAWIGFDPASVEHHPACMLDTRLLCFDDAGAFMEMAAANPEIEWTICTRLPVSMQTLPVHTALVDVSQSIGLAQNDLSARFSRAKRDVSDCSEIESSLMRLSIDEKQRRKKLREAVRDLQIEGGWPSFHLAQRQRAALSVPRCLQEKSAVRDRACMRVELAPSVFWDLSADGPHALVAGMTGSGKSEAMCGVLYQLAWLNTPRQVQFVLIDFKGGSFAAPLIDLPHTAAYLSNLHDGAIGRFEKAIDIELKRRQDAIASWLKKHPDCEPSLEGCPQLNMSHVVICVDEFGQLKARHPEFMKSLQETARIGRSLGFHLILSTQKPAGIVDEQIWSNSKSRLCFQVLDHADSREVLGHENACAIRQAGEFILQVQSKGEQSGRAFYLKDPADGKSRVERFENGTWTGIERQSVQEFMRGRILERNDARQWLLLPDPLGNADAFREVLIDRITSVEPLSLCFSSIAIAGPKDNAYALVERLIAAEERTVYSTIRLRGIDQHIGMGSLYSRHIRHSPCVVIIDEVTSIDRLCLEELAAMPDVTLVLVLEKVSFQIDALISLFSLRIDVGMNNRDDHSLFFQGRQIPQSSWPLVFGLCHNDVLRIVCGQAPALLRKPQVDMQRLEECRMTLNSEELSEIVPCFEEAVFIGMDLDEARPVFVMDQTLSVIWTSSRAREDAMAFCARMQLCHPCGLIADQLTEGMVCALCLEQATEMEAQEIIAAAMERGGVLFFGNGLQSMAFSLGLRMPYEQKGNALWLYEGILRNVQSAMFYS